MRILVTGGAGFVGSSVGLRLKRDRPDDRVVALDNLRRRGSELALERLGRGGVEFRHGDIRNSEDLADAGPFDLLIECSAEPSVHAGYAGNPGYVVNTNLVGTINCLEAARLQRADVIFLSTSRVYPIDGLRSLPLELRDRRLVLPEGRSGPGWSAAGITTEFPLDGSRSIYGATKLCSELLLTEYRAMYGMRTVINRCGVIAGPWQMGKVDQGFFVLWAARHLFGRPLRYIGFGGQGHQVRDVLHVDDLCDLLAIQSSAIERFDGATFNVGGGPESSVSLAELSDLCAARVERPLEIGAEPETLPADVPYYVTDNSTVEAATGWRPRRGPETLLDDVFRWLRDNESRLAAVLGGA